MKSLALVSLLLACLAGLWWSQRNDSASALPLQADVETVEAQPAAVTDDPDFARPAEVNTPVSVTSAREERAVALPAPTPDNGPTFQMRVTSISRGYAFGNKKRESIVFPDVQFQLGARVLGGESFELYEGQTCDDGTALVELP